jgi:hypothetical protein
MIKNSPNGSHLDFQTQAPSPLTQQDRESHATLEHRIRSENGDRSLHTTFIHIAVAYIQVGRTGTAADR